MTFARTHRFTSTRRGDLRGPADVLGDWTLTGSGSAGFAFTFTGGAGGGQSAVKITVAGGQSVNFVEIAGTDLTTIVDPLGRVGVGVGHGGTPKTVLEARRAAATYLSGGSWLGSPYPGQHFAATNPQPGGYDTGVVFFQGTNDGAGGLGSLQPSAFINVTGESSWSQGTPASWVSTIQLGTYNSSNVAAVGIEIFSNQRVKIRQAYYLPNADGTLHQVVYTDGAGNLGFSDVVDLIPDGGLTGRMFSADAMLAIGRFVRTVPLELRNGQVEGRHLSADAIVAIQTFVRREVADAATASVVTSIADGSLTGRMFSADAVLMIGAFVRREVVQAVGQDLVNLIPDGGLTGRMFSADAMLAVGRFVRSQPADLGDGAVLGKHLSADAMNAVRSFVRDRPVPREPLSAPDLIQTRVFAQRQFPASSSSSSGTVTSVALALPAIFTVSGSPVTTTGTLTGTLATQTANFVWAGPTSGAAAAPAFRALVKADIPTFGLFDHSADGASTHTDGTEDTLYTDTIAAGQLAANKDKITAEYGGTIVASATATRRVRVYFAGTSMIDTGDATFDIGGSFSIRVNLIRVSSSVVRYTTRGTFGGDDGNAKSWAFAGEITGLTLSNTQIIKLTGVAQGTGAAASDLVGTMGFITFQPAA